jgi:hypothetical protein
LQIPAFQDITTRLLVVAYLVTVCVLTQPNIPKDLNFQVSDSFAVGKLFE